MLPVAMADEDLRARERRHDVSGTPARMDPVSGPPSDEEALLALAAVERCTPDADALLRDVRAELVAWLLDVDDPVRLRVASA